MLFLGSGAGRSLACGRPGEAHQLRRGHPDGSHADQDVLGAAVLARRRVQLRLHLQDIGRECRIGFHLTFSTKNKSIQM